MKKKRMFWRRREFRRNQFLSIILCVSLIMASCLSVGGGHIRREYDERSRGSRADIK